VLAFHQNETCEGIIRHIEMREGALRRDVRVRDIDNLTSPDARVEMTFRLGDQLYAVEHTGVEPFDGFLENQNRAPAIFDPIKDALNGALDPDGIFELNIPFDCFSGCKMPEVRVIQAALIRVGKDHRTHAASE
jgi:hypothetical protein